MVRQIRVKTATCDKLQICNIPYHIQKPMEDHTEWVKEGG